VPRSLPVAQPEALRHTIERRPGALIEPDVAGAVISGASPQTYTEVIVVDCRYPFEYEGA
jgi:hypothetical protein